MNSEILTFIIIQLGLIVLSLIFAFVMYYLGKTENFLLFYSIIFVPIVFIIALLTYLGVMTSLVELLGPWILIVIMAYLIERIIWAYTLRYTSGEDELGWFLVVWYLGPFGWIIYHFVNLVNG